MNETKLKILLSCGADSKLKVHVYVGRYIVPVSAGVWRGKEERNGVQVVNSDNRGRH